MKAGFLQPAGRYKTHQRRLGRLAAADPRDYPHPRAALLPEMVPRTWRYWYGGEWTGDQDGSPHCVEYTGHHRIEASPKTHPTKGPMFPLGWLYAEAQKNDEWPGEDYDGTSGRGLCKVLLREEVISRYEFLWDVEALERALLYEGPVMLGLNWYDSMWTPDADGFLRIPEGARWEGGHEVLALGCHSGEAKFRIKNSWGVGWGEQGRAWIGYDTMARLFQEEADAIIVTEV